MVRTVPAQRSFRNSCAGTLEMKPLNLNGSFYCSYLTESVFPTVWSKFPSVNRCHVVIQKDNARQHGNVNDAVVLNQGRKDY